MSVTRADVVWCYEKILGRSPESEAVIEAQSHWPDTKQLVLAFVNSDEFRAHGHNTKSTQIDSVPGLPTVVDKLAVEVDATSHDLAMCAAKTCSAGDNDVPRS